MNRLVIAHTPLNSKLLFRSMYGYEELSGLYRYTVELVSDDANIILRSLLGKSLSLQIKQLDAPDHWLNGDIISMVLKGKEGASSRYYVYEATVRPRLWYLSQNRDFKIFQEKTVPDIIMQVLSDYNSIVVENKLTGSYRTWGYCVQYNESSFDFISRLMEHEGIYYYFKHASGVHTLVLVDAIDVHEPSIFPVVPYRGINASALADETCVDQWQVYDGITSKMVSMDDYDFRKPYATLLDVKENAVSFAEERTVVYEWPGRFVDKGDTQPYLMIRQQEHEAQQQQMNGSATSASFTPGQTFALIKAARASDNQEYLIVRAQYSIWDNTYASGADADRGQRTDFTVIPTSSNWRSPRITAWPKTQGPQTARVVCPPGETIWTDKYGRVKVKFHWDHYAKGDDTSSCWIRVASAWAGQGYGAIQIPRLNDEVVVDFINGDPDRPIIIGRVYNDANLPPWNLPANSTQMGFYSRSKTGHKETANALRFEDKMGEEQVWVHAEKDMDTDIENNETLDVGVDRTKTIGQDETSHIKRNRTETVDADETITVHGVRTEEVDGDETITIHSNRIETVDIDETISIGANRMNTIGANHTESIGGNHSETVTGNDTLTVMANQVETIAIAKAETIGAAKALTIGGAYQISVGAAMNTTVALAKAEQVGLMKSVIVGKNYSQQIGTDKSVNVGKNSSLNVGKDHKVNAGDDIRIIAGKSIELICGKASIKMKKDGTIVINGNTYTLKTSSNQNVKAGGNITMKAKKILEN